jgi:translation initiation factor IF-2
VLKSISDSNIKPTISMTKKEFKVDIKRAPIVAVMGHVDHGKTSLLDAIRGTSVQEGEVGGITQNTRAHEVKYGDYSITFVDTPGHEAFSEMRMRGAKLTDIVMLVVAADDGIQPQTKESIKFAKESGTPIVVAVNKVDLPDTNLEKIKSQLAQNDIVVESYGGDVQMFPTSAKTKEGLDELLEGLLLQAELQQIKKRKNTIGHGEAVVLESKLDKNLGAISLVLVKSGNIAVGDYATNGKDVSAVRAILDEYQQKTDQADESKPIWIVGLESVLSAGESIYFTDGEKEASQIRPAVLKAEEEAIEEVQAEIEEIDDMTRLAELLANVQVNESIKKLNVVVKADTKGTLDVVLKELEKLNDEDVEVHVLLCGTGDITRKDVVTAKNGNGIVLGFQVIVPADLTPIVRQEKVLVRVYSVIYELIDEVADAMEGMLEPEKVEEEVATANIKQVFVLSDGSTVAGCFVEHGKVIKGYRAKVMRGEEEMGRGKIISLKQNKNEVKEMQKGTECGILIDSKIEMEVGDKIVLYKVS